MVDDRHGSPAPVIDGFELLGQPVRRRLLLTVYRGNPTDLDDLRANDINVGGEDQKLVGLALNYSTIQELHDRGYINWDPETETLTRGDRFDEIAPLLQLLDDHADELPDDWP